jgi:hypothetical protein
MVNGPERTARPQTEFQSDRNCASVRRVQVVRFDQFWYSNSSN